MTGTSGNWVCRFADFSTSQYLKLNGTEAVQSYSNIWGDAVPTSSVVGLGVAASISANQAFLSYHWHSVDGYSKIGKYTANGNADGPFIYTGFKPAFIIVKSADATYGWFMFDNARDPDNPVRDYLEANSTAVSAQTDVWDFLANGFKVRIGTGSGANNSTDTYYYMAFAEHPFVGDGTNPATAR